MDRKKRIGFVTNSAVAIKTGFQRNAETLISYLYKTGKYEIFHLVQGFKHDDPRILEMQPWNTKGTITDEDFQNQRFQTDPNFQRFVSYGNLAVEKWVIDNKLDSVVHIEDIWSSSPDFYWKKDWFNFIKKNFINHTTLDSVPILKEALTWAENCPNFWVWADFAEREMKEIDPVKYGHVQTTYGTLNCEDFQILGSEERAELRKKFGISPNEIIINMTSRNQLRKLFYANIEGLSKYKRLYSSGKKVRLLFHTSWSDAETWPLDIIRQEHGLDQDDILTSYYCSECRNWSVRPFYGEKQDCPHCGAKNAYSTAGINSTITSKDLSKIYGICDAMSHQMTSGGLEYAIVEGLLCGLPVGTNGYSSGETFTRLPFVENIDFTLTREPNQSAFYKAVPNPNAVAKFFKKIADMTPEKRREIGLRGRRFVLENFHVNVIGKKFENFFDNAEFLDWEQYHSFKKDYDVKTPDAEIDINIESDVDFIKSLYKNIMKMDLPIDDSGFVGWLNNLTSLPPETSPDQKLSVRKRIWDAFKEIAHKENVKNNPIDYKTFIDFDRPNKRLILAMKQSGGDIFMTTSLLKGIKKKYGKNTDIYFMCDPKYNEILEGNPYIHKVIPWFDPFANEMNAIGAGKKEEDRFFHYFLFPAVSTQAFLNYLSQKN